MSIYKISTKNHLPWRERVIKTILVVLCIATVLSFMTQTVFAQEKKVLQVIGWDVYADPKHKNKTIGYQSFENAFNVQIEFTPLSSLDENIDIAESQDDFDVLIISNEGIRLLCEMGLVVPLNMGKIPNYQNLYHMLRYSDWSKFKRRIYAVPWAWGPTGLLYNTDVITEPDSWNILWDPKYKGQVSLWDDVSMIWTAALALGYENVYNLTRKQLKQVKEKLLELNINLHEYYKGDVEALELVLGKKVVALNSWFDPSAHLSEKGYNFKMVVPKEGAVGMFDSYMIGKKTPRTEIAHAFINHQISPSVQKQMVRITGLAPANSKTQTLLKPEEIKRLHLGEKEYFNSMLLWDFMPRKHLYEAVLQEVRRDLESRR